MESFEDLGLKPELIESLIAEGIERPTHLQEEVIPTLRKGNSALIRGGPGAGVLVSYGTALLDRLDAGQGSPLAVVLVPERPEAVRKARALARAAITTGHRVAALSGSFALPGRADILFATPADLLAATRTAEVKLDGVVAWVLDGAAALLEDPHASAVLSDALEAVPTGEAQGIVIAEPITPEVREFTQSHLPRAVHIPSDAATPAEPEEAPVQRGTLRILASEQGAGQDLVALVDRVLGDGDAHHALLFFRGEDRAADAADLLALHGFLSGAPGEPDFPVWLAVDAMEARRAIDADSDENPVVAVSVGSPTDVDELDRRHGGSRAGGVVLAPARQIPHLRRLGSEAGYALEFLSPPTRASEDAARRMHDMVRRAVEEADLAPYHGLLQPAVREFGSPQVSAALAWLLRSRSSGPKTSAPGTESETRPAPGAPVPFLRLFLSIGSRDGVGPGDLLGAITGEAGVKGDEVGRIDIRDTFSRVDVSERVAARVIEALNGITVKGRSVRADYDRSIGRDPGTGGKESGPRAPGGRTGRGPGRGARDR
ncbi:MAG: hypothetical protein EA351_09130 [Gemmatimonadales bacterium]|nr:MAG: hypothetical protein EA351_09130 [Gemmatimonadales bacterium]